MLTKTVFEHFTTKTEIWQKLELTSGAVSQWGDLVPEKQAMKLERITNGALKYDPAMYKKTA